MPTNGFLCQFLRVVLHCLLLLQLLEHVPTASADGHCVWYGECSTKTFFDRHRNCVYDGPPLPIDEASRPIIEKYCPEIAAGGVSCCNHEQVLTMERNIVIVQNVVSRCPSCFDNFLKHICGMACAPDQSHFMKVVNVDPFNVTHQSIKEIDYHLSATYMIATYNSCAEVELPSSDLLAMDVMCGEFGAENCTADRWFDFMGDANNPFVPFQINYIGGDVPAAGYTPYDPPTRPCNVGTPGKAACLCYDCEESCL